MAVRLPLDQAIAHRYPAVIATDAFLNDTLVFNADTRFDAFTALQDAADFPMVTRDEASFNVVDIGIDEPQIYSVEMYSPTYSRTNYFRVFK